MAFESKIAGLHMVVEAVEAERGSSLNPPASTPYSLTIYLDYPEYWIRTDQTAVRISAALKVVPEAHVSPGLQRLNARFIFEFLLSAPTDAPEVETFLHNPPVVDSYVVPYISAFTARLSQDMAMHPITLAARPSGSPLTDMLLRGGWPAAPRTSGV